jgi:hypothetical protein
MEIAAGNGQKRTEDNFAAIQNADQLVSGGFIVINFDKFYDGFSQEGP